MASSKIKLYYFNARGRGEVVRLTLAAAGRKYEDIRFQDRDDWVKNYKSSAPFSQAPYVEMDGKKYAQSVALANYFARESNMYGKSNLDALKIEQVEGLVQDLIALWVKASFSTEDEAQKAKLMKTLTEEDYPRFIGYFENLLKESGNGYFVGNSLTPADLAVYDVLDGVVAQNPAALKSSPQLTKNRQNVLANKGVADYIKSRPKTDF